ncbi:MAG TPA: isochorismatase family protein [Burkholderiaceae bacterium]|nr:isochorismatase family protein [Burkholderiaceae bacterium]
MIPSHALSDSPTALRSGDALLIVDVQRDFLAGGSLAVPKGEVVLEPLNHLISIFNTHGWPIIATRDWHPSQHCSFQSQGGPWPPHCVADSAGAKFADQLALPESAYVISKATTEERDAYSGFSGTRLRALLERLAVKRLVVGGLATDYCVLNTVLDAREHGYEVMLATDAIAAVNVSPGDDQRALARMTAAGAMLTSTANLKPSSIDLARERLQLG